MVSNETVQCDVYSCLTEADECALNRAPHLVPGYLVVLDGSPAFTGLYMIDMIPAYDGSNPSSCLVSWG